ncbi:MAG: carbohydrate-binding domain-containing protein, partial [Lachnospiraceae bacterium]|nr:carbohydrate-binding domain-containing protein [Lachnospiraceae bacterium]
MKRSTFTNTALCTLLAASMMLAGCSGVAGTTAASNIADTTTQIKTPSTDSADASNGSVSTDNLLPGTSVDYASVTANDPAAVEAVDAETLSSEISGDFEITGDGTAAVSNGTCTITEAGEYTLTGSLSGSIIIDAGEDAEVTLVLAGASITSSDAAPIYVVSADKVTVKAQNGTYNEIVDNRTASTGDSEEKTPATGAGAITAYCDLTISGKGTLVITGNYNNGIHTTKDLKIKNLTLKVRAADNALKGKDSVTVEGAQIIAIALSGDGIRTDNSNVSSKGSQRGTVTITDSTVSIYSTGQGIDAAYDVIIGGETNININTGSYSEYCTDKKAESSGIKADNSVTIENGIIYINSTKDAIHANSDVQLENGSYGAGVVTVSGGSLVINASDDGIHADSTLNVTGGYIDIKT